MRVRASDALSGFIVAGIYLQLPTAGQAQAAAMDIGRWAVDTGPS